MDLKKMEVKRFVKGFAKKVAGLEIKTVEFKLNVDAKDALRLRGKKLVFAVFDYDMMSSNDPMGEVEIPLEALWGGQVVEESYPVKNCKVSGMRVG